MLSFVYIKKNLITNVLLFSLKKKKNTLRHDVLVALNQNQSPAAPARVRSNPSFVHS